MLWKWAILWRSGVGIWMLCRCRRQFILLARWVMRAYIPARSDWQVLPPLFSCRFTMTTAPYGSYGRYIHRWPKGCGQRGEVDPIGERQHGCGVWYVDPYFWCSLLHVFSPPVLLLYEFLPFFYPFAGLGNSSAVGPSMVGQLATAFLDTLYKA